MIRSSRRRLYVRSGHSILAFLALTTALTADAITSSVPQGQDGPYQGIVDRNAFALKPPPPPPDPEATKPPPSKITLTGITTILGPRALMKTPPAPAKPGETPKPEHSYILGVSQREGDIEVLEIDDKAGSVKVNNAGIVVMLTFEKDGPKLPATPLPAVPGIPIPGLPAPTGAAPASAGQTGLNPGFTMPTRIPRVPGAAAGAETASVTPGTSSMSAAQQAAAQRTPEESALLYEAN